MNLALEGIEPEVPRLILKVCIIRSKVRYLVQSMQIYGRLKLFAQ